MGRHNITTKIAISIGKGLGNLLKTDDCSVGKKTFRSYLRILVGIEVCNPLKPGFNFRKDEGESLKIFLKYERLDIYCTLCGRIGYKLIHCTAHSEEKFPAKYSVSFQVNIFSNLLPLSPLQKTSPNIAITQTQPSTSHTRLSEPTQPSEANLIPVPNT